jgi:hypothetical protein
VMLSNSVQTLVGEEEDVDVENMTLSMNNVTARQVIMKCYTKKVENFL